MAKKKSKKAKQPTFEESLEQLETIVGKLEGGQLGLAESLEEYEQGVAHLNACYGLLNEAERRIEKVGKVDASGQAHTQPFDEAAADESLEEKASGRSRRRSVKSARQVDDGSSLF